LTNIESYGKNFILLWREGSQLVTAGLHPVETD
jgi:hypothetical protein